MEGGDLATFVDRSVVPGAAYEYRLKDSASGAWLTSPAHVSVPLARLRFIGSRPSPASMRSLRLAIELQSRLPARLELLDVAGRRVAQLPITNPSPGGRALEAAGLVHEPGVYWVRLQQGQRSVAGRIVVIR